MHEPAPRQSQTAEMPGKTAGGRRSGTPSAWITSNARRRRGLPPDQPPGAHRPSCTIACSARPDAGIRDSRRSRAGRHHRDPDAARTDNHTSRATTAAGAPDRRRIALPVGIDLLASSSEESTILCRDTRDLPADNLSDMPSVPRSSRLARGSDRDSIVLRSHRHSSPANVPSSSMEDDRPSKPDFRASSFSHYGGLTPRTGPGRLRFHSSRRLIPLSCINKTCDNHTLSARADASIQDRPVIRRRHSACWRKNAIFNAAPAVCPDGRARLPGSETRAGAKRSKCSPVLFLDTEASRHCYEPMFTGTSTAPACIPPSGCSTSDRAQTALRHLRHTPLRVRPSRACRQETHKPSEMRFSKLVDVRRSGPFIFKGKGKHPSPSPEARLGCKSLERPMRAPFVLPFRSPPPHGTTGTRSHLKANSIYIL